MKTRYRQNVSALSEDACERLTRKKVCVVGCGGLGGTVAELLARAGVGYLTLVDPDVFQESNLNRQIFCTEHNLGTHKVEAAKERLTAINSDVTVCAIAESFSEENAVRILTGHDVVVDGLDNIPDRRLLAKHCRCLSIPFVHGAVRGWSGQVSTVFPEDNTMDLMYQEEEKQMPDPGEGSFTATVAATASFQCSEVLKLLTGEGQALSRSLLIIDLLGNESVIMDLH